VKLYFLTTNPFKISEARDYFACRKIDAVELCVVEQDVQEILHPDVTVIVRQKAIDAYEYIRHPCVVEHGGLFMDALPGLPGGVGKIVWNAVGDRMCSFLRDGDDRSATARAFLGYCDGKRVSVHVGETRGKIADRARGAYQFAWDPIFMPEQSAETYGEMGQERKRATSPVFKAWDGFLKALSVQTQRANP
jgi:XTP/dITP diphosphohydrolase